MAERIRVAHVYDWMCSQGGGAERSILSILRGLNQDKFDPYLFLTRRVSVEEEFNLQGIKVFPKQMEPHRRAIINHCKRISPVYACTQIMEVWKLARAGVDILHIHSDSFLSRWVAAVCAKCLNIPVVNTVRVYADACSISGGRQLLRNVPDFWIFLTPDHAEIMRPLLPDQKDVIRVIPNGIDVPRFQNPRVSRETVRSSFRIGDSTLLLCVGRLDASSKDFETLFSAFERIRQSCDKAKLLVLGAGRDAAKVRSFAEDLELERSVRFLGHRNDIPEFMNAADALLFPTHGESFGRVAAEAMAAGCPVVASNVIGPRYVCDYGNAGLLAEPQDPEDMAKKTLRIINDPSLREKLKRNGRERAEKMFSVPRMVQRHQQLYEELLGIC
ncbi:MAG: glycosyltransferase family 4 protein [Candidatus Brocadiia bacterium]